MLKLNGQEVKAPKSMSVTIADLDGETHSAADGTLIRDRITVKRKLQVEWGVMTQAEIQQILTNIQNVFFTVEFTDPLAGTKTCTMYVGDRSSDFYSWNLRGQIMYSGLKADFIEQ